MCEIASESSLFSAVMFFFEEDGWKYQRADEKEMLLMYFRGEHASWRCIAQVDPDQDLFLFYSVLDSYVPSHKREEVSLFLTRANYGMRIGNFELDLDDGEIRFKTSLAASGTEASSEMISRLVYYNLAMMDKYYRGLMRVVFAEITPEEAIQEIEG